MKKLTEEEQATLVSKLLNVAESLNEKDCKDLTSIPHSFRKANDEAISALLTCINLFREAYGIPLYPVYVPIVLYGSITNNGDGSASIHFFINQESAEKDQEIEQARDGWGESCYKDIDSYIGSDEYHEALENEEAMKERWEEFKEEYPD